MVILFYIVCIHDLGDEPQDLKNKLTSDWMSYRWQDLVYRQDMGEVGDKLYQAAKARESLGQSMTVIATLIGFMIVVPAVAYIIKRYLKQASSRQREKDLEHGTSAQWPNPARMVEPIIPLVNLPRIADQVHPPLAVQHTVKVARDNDGGRGVNSIESTSNT